MEEKKNQPVASGTVKQDDFFTSADKFLFGEQGFGGVVGDIIHNAIVPIILGGIATTLTGAIERAILGDRPDINKRYTAYGRGVSNVRYYGGRTTREVDYSRSSVDIRRTNNSTDLKEVLFDNRVDVQAVFDNMVANIDQYGLVSVADYYELSAIDAKFIDHSFGWTNLDGTSIVQISSGQYVLELPKPKQL